MQLVTAPDLGAAGGVWNGRLDFVAYWEEGKESWLREYLGASYEESPERYRERSPPYQADRVQAPVLFLYREHDPTISHARTFCERLEDRGWREGEEFEFVELSGEGHYSESAEHRRQRFRIFEGFFDRWLGDA